MTYQPTEDEIRHRRNVYLETSDKHVLADRWDSYTAEQKQIWRDYRQALRDMPSQPGWPIVGQFTWPAAPVDLGVETFDEWPPELV